MARLRSKLRDEHIKFGRSTKYEKDSSFFDGKNSDTIIAEAMSEIDRLGYRIVHRDHMSFTTTMGVTIFLSANFEKFDKEDRAAILWHELVHARQWHDSSNLFPLRYLNRRWQWAFEVQGYRQQVRVIRELRGDKYAKALAYKIPSIMQRKPYTMRRLDASHLRAETLKAFEIGLPGLKLF